MADRQDTKLSQRPLGYPDARMVGADIGFQTGTLDRATRDPGNGVGAEIVRGVRVLWIRGDSNS